MSKDGETLQRAFLPDFCATRSVLVVVVVAELLALVMTLAATHYDEFSLERLALSSLFIQWVALSSAAVLCGLRDRLNQWSLSAASVAVVVAVVLITVVFSLVVRLVIRWMLGPEGVFIAFWDYEVLVNGAIAAIIAGVMMRYFYVQELLRIKGEAELQARIQALQSRIRPHFLFNSMNIIASLIAVDPDAAEQVVEDLSRLFRASLKETGNEVCLAEELDLCRRYVRIEQLRIGERLQVEWQVEADEQTTRVPLLTLQPLLENAIYHGIQPLAEGGVVTVQVTRDGNAVQMRVINPCQAGASAHRGNQMALENIRHRLQALYGPAARLDSRPGNDQYEVVIGYTLTERDRTGSGS